MGDPPASTELLLHRQRMRIRTIAVSFAAAVSSAHRDLAVGPAERDALIETWRAWCLRVLAGYGEEIEALRATHDAWHGEDAATLDAELADAIESVRRA